MLVIKIILSTVIRFMLKFKRIRKKSLRNKVNSTNFFMEQAEAQKQKIKEIVIVVSKS
jgi:hypothetical protein